MAKQQAINLTQFSVSYQQAQASEYLEQLGDTMIREQELTGIARLVAHFPVALPGLCCPAD